MTGLPREDRAVLTRFKDAMLQKLRENAHKNHWSTCSVHWLVEKAFVEISEMYVGMAEEQPPDHVRREAADAANFLMMAADNYRRRYESKRKRRR